MPNRPVSEVIEKKTFPTASATTTVRAIAKIMKESHSSAVLIVEKKVLTGICTERDIVLDAVAEGLDLDVTHVSVIMTHKVQTIAPDKPFVPQGQALRVDRHSSAPHPVRASPPFTERDDG